MSTTALVMGVVYFHLFRVAVIGRGITTDSFSARLHMRGAAWIQRAFTSRV